MDRINKHRKQTAFYPIALTGVLLILSLVICVGCDEQAGQTINRVGMGTVEQSQVVAVGDTRASGQEDSGETRGLLADDAPAAELRAVKARVRNMIRQGEFNQHTEEHWYQTLDDSNGKVILEIFSSESKTFYAVDLVIFSISHYFSQRSLVLFDVEGNEMWEAVLPSLRHSTIQNAKVSNDGNSLFILGGQHAESTREMRMIDRQGQVTREWIFGDEYPGEALCIEEFSPNGTMLVIGLNQHSAGSNYSIYDTGGNLLYEFQLGISSPRRVMFSYDSKYVLIISNNPNGGSFNVADIVEKKVIVDVTLDRKLYEISFADDKKKVRIDTNADPLFFSYPDFIQQ